MSGLELIDVSKSYGATRVLDGVSLAIGAGEFVAFLGPSGSGKSTLLRIIAGLESLDAGEVWLGGERIDGLAPGARGIAMVFQHYALYPHMTVRENMAFGLVNAGVPKDEIARRIAQAAETLEIATQLDKKPGQMSGGQRQRVAIGRAIVKKPKLFLLDEPLSNLDAALRGRTRVELAQLRTRVDAALVMVTHDQSEAMTLADRIVVMNDRRIQQVGTPAEVYARPANAFVAGFVGSPAMAMLPARVAGHDGARVRIGLPCGADLPTAIPAAAGLEEGAPVTLGLRAEHVTLAPPATPGLPARIDLVERLGDRTYLYARLSDGSEIIAHAPGFSAVRPGEAVTLAVDAAAAHVFTADGTAHHPGPRA
ncbi:ABC transporter ATP-binding protein [Erythrobacter sp. WG]|uniref:ABC transporter ATP-binding protein n=1 Tax=Erythrobacter sp. WG TaxID=2985510 RepID=UPI00226EB105|nr:ATP-binding cassette domain-containing protein [Erythrobacter sp. WG]MCX9147933.1 ATP-binding cassette domain-containing protein [Erythrobacter sp. WG]